MKKIGLAQSKDEYPGLSIIVTDNPRYLEKRKTFMTRQAAIETISRWLDINLMEDGGAK